MFHQHGRSAPERELLYGRQTLRECLRARRRALHILWVADGVPTPIRILQREEGQDSYDLRLVEYKGIQ